MKSIKRLARPVLSLTVLLLAACAGTEAGEGTAGAPTEAGMPTEVGGAPGDLTGTQWTLASFGPAGTETPVAAGSSVTLEFGTDGQAGGSGGCNSYGTTYQVEGDTLSFDEITSTAMACADEQVMQQEGEYYEALRSAGRFEVTEDSLTIWYNNGQEVLNFTPS